MKQTFSYFKSAALSFLVIALVLTCVPVSAENYCCCEESDESEFEWTDPLEKTVKFGYDMYEYVPLMRGPLLITFAPCLGVGWSLFLNYERSAWEKSWKIPYFATLFTGISLGYGTLQTITLGNLSM